MSANLCPRVQGLLEAFYEGLLSSRQAEIVAAHVQQCPSCSRELAQIEKIAMALAAVPETEPGAEIVHRISTRVAALPAPMSGRRQAAGWRRVEVLAAACVALLAIWRYALPLLLSKEAAKLPIIGWLNAALVYVMGRMATLSLAGHSLWVALQGTSEALGLAAAKVAPILGLYAAAELGIIAALVMLTHYAHRLRPASLTMLT